MIRHMLYCDTNGLNMRDTTLSYRSETDDFKYGNNASESQLKVMRGIFLDPDNSNFVIHVFLDVYGQPAVQHVVNRL